MQSGPDLLTGVSHTGGVMQHQVLVCWLGSGHKSSQLVMHVPANQAELQVLILMQGMASCQLHLTPATSQLAGCLVLQSTPRLSRMGQPV